MKGVQENSTNWTSGQVYVLALVCLACGILLGYLFRGSSPAEASKTTASASAPTDIPSGDSIDTVTAPLLASLQKDPNNVSALTDLGNAYYDHRNYDQAVQYYGKALQLEPDNLSVRTDMGTAYWYLGDANRAVQEFDHVLKQDPKHPQTLFNLGIVKWQGLKDRQGAIATWQKLLQLNPDYPQKAQVEALIRHAESNGKDIPQ